MWHHAKLIILNAKGGVMDNKCIQQSVVIVFVLISFLLMNAHVTRADANTPFTTMFITCYTTDVESMGDVIIELYPDGTIKANLPFNILTGSCKGTGEGTWNATGSFVTTNFKVTLHDGGEEIAFSITAMTIMTSIFFMPDFPNALLFVLGKGTIIDAACALSEKEKISILFFGFCSSKPYSIILH
jgi:type 1 fimbria pilin